MRLVLAELVLKLKAGPGEDSSRRRAGERESERKSAREKVGGGERRGHGAAATCLAS